MKFLRYTMAIIFFLPCTLSFAQNSKDTVFVLPIKVSVPANAKKLGTIRTGNNATKTNCDYEQMVMHLKEKASAMGGNIVKITQLTEPAFIGKCYKIHADVYYAKELPAYKVQNSNENDAPSGTPCALLNIYRLKDTVAFAPSYDVHFNNDSVICTVKSKSKDVVKLYKEGPVTLWAKNEKRKDVKLNVKFGETYYVRCGLEHGEIKMAPVMELMDKNEGATEYEQLAKGKKDMDVKYLQQIH